MFASAFATLAIGLYLIATGLLCRAVFANHATSNKLATILAIAALALHWADVASSLYPGFGLNTSLHSMTLLISAVIVSLFWFGSFKLPIKELGLLVYPVTALSILFSLFWPDHSQFIPDNPLLVWHVIVSILAYAFITLATIQSLVYAYQDRQIKGHALLLALPALQTMETLLFALIRIGFVLLSLTLLTGTFFSKELFGHAFAFKHHIVLALAGWLVFLIVLIKRQQSGMRSKQAMLWTMGGFVLLQLSYFGTKFVSESLAA